jgi:predicted DNA-binding transcriptional regulator AlpA
MTQIVEPGRNGRAGYVIEAGDAELVLSVKAWARLASLGYSTAKKLLREGNGPRKTRLTMHRVGITLSSHREWLRERTEAHRACGQLTGRVGERGL